MTGYRSSKSQPCPVCDRDRDADCWIKEAANLVLCHSLLDGDLTGESLTNGYRYLGRTDKGAGWGVWGYRGELTQQGSYKPLKPTKEQKRVDYFYENRQGDRFIKAQRYYVDDKKAFAQYEKQGRRWVKELSEAGKRGVLPYRYSEAKLAAGRGQPVYWLEGEDAADRFWELGLAAVTTIGGGGGYSSYGDYSGLFEGIDLIICPDRDIKGIKYASDVLKGQGSAKSIRWLYAAPQSPLWKINLPIDGGLDAADWIADGATVEAIAASIETVQREFTPEGLWIQPQGEKKAKEPMTYDQAIEELQRIFAIENPALQEWELEGLAQKARRSSNHLARIYEKFKIGTLEFNPRDIHDFLGDEPEERQWLIAANVSCGTTIGLIADSGVGKTILCYDLCKAIATGRDWNGFRTKKSKVLILQTDEPEIDTKERLEIARFREEIDRGQVAIETRWQFSQIKKIEEWLKANVPKGESAFIMIDSFASTNRSAGTNENDADHALGLYELRDLANHHNVTFMILHHLNKMGGSRGTSAFTANLSEIWYLRKGAPADNLSLTQRILEIGKSRSGCTGVYQVELNVDDYSWKHQGDFGLDEGAALPLSARIMRFLELNRGAFYSAEEIAAAESMGGITKNAARKQMERMHRKGQIDSEPRILQRETGASRYKVYRLSSSIVPVQSGEITPHPENNPDSDELTSEAQTYTEQSSCSLVNPEALSTLDQRVEPIQGKDQSLAGQPPSETPRSHKSSPRDVSTNVTVEGIADNSEAIRLGYMSGDNSWGLG